MPKDRGSMLSASVLHAVWTLPMLLVFATPMQAAEPPSPGTVRAPFVESAPAAPGDRATGIQQAPGVIPDIRSGGPQIPVKSFEFTGNQSLTTAQLQARVSRYLGQKLTLLEIYEIADELTAYYRSLGYTLATVNIPAQKVATGVIRLEVIEGQIEDVLFEGNDSYSDDFIRDRLGKLAPGQPVIARDLQTQLLLINDLPGVHTRAVIKPGDAYGTSDLIFRSTEDRVAGSVGITNSGRDSIGRWRIEGDIAFNNPTGRGDQIRLNGVNSESGRLTYGRIAYSAALGVNGTRLAASFARYTYNVDVEEIGFIPGVDFLDGEGEDYRFDLTHPLLRGRNRNLAIAVAFRRTATEQAGGGALVPLTPERSINLFEYSVNFNNTHKDRSVTNAIGVASTNFRDNPTGNRNNAQRARLFVQASHERRLPYVDGWSLFGRLRGVLSADPLVDTERFRIGGPTSVRGFPSAEVSGDQGVELTVEARRQFVLADKVPTTFRVFWDGGRVYNKEHVINAQVANESLTSVGIGATATISNRYVIDLIAAKPTNSRLVSDSKDNGRVWLGFRASF